MSLLSKSDDEGGEGSKISKNDDVFYERVEVSRLNLMQFEKGSYLTSSKTFYSIKSTTQKR